MGNRRVKRTIHLARERFHWSNMTKKITQHMTKCCSCHKGKDNVSITCTDTE
ncbi:hypothetical protein HOLleu_09923 [Holothuria leucospilota]|uniref:Integrase zinc-binding domain-containing protein n=1 Tax=Holothuria leucospilota TaxID=206669 RepID=A0A9Q1CE48_HOLLE|nr:hypothetical protein HOLleu_09923 [Holothuria leucospilota]